MHVPARKNIQTGAPARFLIAKPEIPIQRVGRPSVYIMPDPEPRRGNIERMVESAECLPRIFTSLALAGAVVLATLALKWAWFALQIPFPGR